MHPCFLPRRLPFRSLIAEMDIFRRFCFFLAVFAEVIPFAKLLLRPRHLQIQNIPEAFFLRFLSLNFFAASLTNSENLLFFN